MSLPGDLDDIRLLLAACIVLLAYLLRGIAGFGSGLIAIPFLALLLPLQVVVPTIVLLDYLASASHGIKHRESIQWRDLLPLLPFSVLGVLAALYLFKNIDSQVLTSILGTFIIVYAVYSLFNLSSSNGISRTWALPAGALGGFVGTLFGTGGPFYVLYLKFRGLEKTQFRATFATIFLLDGVFRLSGYLFFGMFPLGTILLICAGLPLMVLGMYFGGRIHTNMSQLTFQRAISLLLAVSGISLLLK